MDFILSCKVKKIGETQSGVSKSGKEWKKRDFLVEETGSQYNKEVFFYVMGTLCDTQIKVEDDIIAHLEVSSREYNGKYYNEVKCFNIEVKKPNLPF